MKNLLFLDFDGVVADSIPECFVVSWIAYHQLLKKMNPESVKLADYQLFRDFRPFIRIGSDYIFLQKAIDSSISLNRQDDFDLYLQSHDQDEKDYFYKIFYQAREDLLKYQAEYWYSLNPLFSHMAEFLKNAAANSRVFILSTKKAWFIEKILSYNNIHIPIERIIDSGRDIKAEIIEAKLLESGYKEAIFIDDQLDHFKYINTSSIKGYLPSWGYLDPKWLENSDFPILSPEASSRLLKTFLE